MEVEVVREIPSMAVIPAHMKIVCNLGPANLKNDGLDEGVYLEVAGFAFSPFGFGVTVFTPTKEHED